MNKIIFGDCRQTLADLAASGVRVQMCVTSPPYFGLRDYGTGTWEGGDPTCAHGVQHWDGPKQTQGAQSGHSASHNRLNRTSCQCGAVRVDHQLGLEFTPDEYVANLVQVFRGVWDVLEDDGTLWLNLGDSFASAWACSRRNVIGSGSLDNGKRANRPNRLVGGLKEKDLIGIPWRVAFALQADGWYLRAPIIWHKPNAMPGSQKDRPTLDYETVFLLSKRPRYFYDHEAIKEPAVSDHASGNGFVRPERLSYRNNDGSSRGNTAQWQPTPMRTARAVWTIPTSAYKGAHFATMAPALAERCIKAGSRPGDIVLDPFGGSGTTAAVAQRLGRQWLLCELNQDYGPLIEQRLTTTGTM